MADDYSDDYSDDDDDDYARAQHNDPCLNRCLCTLLVFLVALGALAATRTTIFDKMKGGPLNDTEFAVGVAAAIIFFCVSMVCISRRMDHNAAVQRAPRQQQQQQQQQQQPSPLGKSAPGGATEALSISPADAMVAAGSSSLGLGVSVV